MKVCTRCGEPRAPANPEKNRAKSARYRERNGAAEAERNKRAQLARRYGLSLEAFLQMADAQEGRCAICGHLPTGVHPDVLFVDHDHDTGQVRALLCRGCNFGLGHFNDDPSRIEAAAAYLRDHNASFKGAMLGLS